MAGGGMVKQMTAAPETQTPETTSTAQSPMSGGKGAGRVIPTTPLVSREQFVNRIGPEPIPRGLDNPVFRSLGQQRMEDRQDMAYNRFVNTTSAGGQEQFLSNPLNNPSFIQPTGETQEQYQNRMRPPQTGGLGAKAIFKQGGLIGLMRRR